ncbi:lipoprotein NlpI [Glaciecola sp. 1036]|uniref:lipoprotein NlpI n=1 Tax=Alteromonadaceae TaxID=72275 RepID=UPI003D0233E5
MTKDVSISLIVLLFIATLSGCQSLDQSRTLQSNLLIAEPEPISQRTQMVIARYTHILYKAPLNDEERAELLYQRGIAYDAIGLTSLAAIDYNEALRLKPDLAGAHNFVGVHHIQQGNYVQAYEAFDSTLELNPDYDFALLNRGIALYYGGRSELAVKDATAFWKKEPTDPYRVLWLYITDASVDPIKAIEALAEHRKNLDEDNWVTVIIDFYLGNASEKAVVARLLDDVNSHTELNNRLCEAYFYLGKYHAARGNQIAATNYFKLSLSTNVHEFVEHKYSRIELSNIRASQAKPVSPN